MLRNSDLLKNKCEQKAKSTKNVGGGGSKWN